MTSQLDPSVATALVVALDALAEGRVMDATLMLAECMPAPKYSHPSTVNAQRLDAALKLLAAPPNPKVGDILYSSWGYDQTNIDYYQVVKVSKASVWIRSIGKECLAGGGRGQDEVVPVANRWTDADQGKGEMHRFRPGVDVPYRYSITLTSYSHATLWDGKPRYETAWGYGH
jgi:hypothetical protein